MWGTCFHVMYLDKRSYSETDQPLSLSLLLVHSGKPPLSIVRRFAHLLERSQRDYWEELELLDLQETVVRGIRFNQQLESDLNLMDIKIGLLVKNRITLQVRREQQIQGWCQSSGALGTVPPVGPTPMWLPLPFFYAATPFIPLLTGAPGGI